MRPSHAVCYFSCITGAYEVQKGTTDSHIVCWKTLSGRLLIKVRQNGCGIEFSPPCVKDRYLLVKSHFNVGGTL